MRHYLVLPTKSGTLDAFSFNRVHGDSQFWLSTSPFPPVPTSPFPPVPLLKKVNSMEQINGADINTKFLTGLFSYCYITHNNMSSCTFTVNIHELMVYPGLSCGSKSFDVYRGIRDLGNFWGVINNHNGYKLISDIVRDKNTVTFNSFYFHILILYMKYKSEDTEVRSSFYTSIVKSEIVKCKNKSAVEIVLVLSRLIARRGTFAGGASHLSVGKLLAQCPTLAHRIKNSVGGRKNYVLRTAWDTALGYIDEFVKYSALKITVHDVLKTECLREVINISVKSGIAVC